VSPFELMAGKILGLVAVGLTNAAVFVAALAVFAGSTGLLKAPGVTLLTLFLAYYLLGFVMYACVFASVGAACNTLKDAQAVMMPLTLAMILPLMLAMNVAQHPDGFWAVALSIFPPTAPMFMILRIVVLPAPPWLEIVISLALLAQVGWLDILLMGVTALIAAANWWWAVHRPTAGDIAFNPETP
jgi:ABC-2 type transport system permease protein